MNKNPTIVTVFMAAYNAAPYIAQSIQSVLNQSFRDFELLIVNDGSTDNTVEIIKSFDDPRIRLIENDGNRGLGYTRNIALKEARGEFLAILDADDIAFPDRLAKQVDYLLANPNLAVLGSYAHIIDKEGNRTGENITVTRGSERLRVILFFSNTFVHSSIMMRTAVFREVGGYPDHPVAQDYALFVRVGLKYDVDNLPEFLVEYRMHDSNISRTKQEYVRTELEKILLYQLNLLLTDAEHINLDVLLDEVSGSKYTPMEYYTIYRELILQNRKKEVYPIREFEQILLDKWYTIVMEKGKMRAFGLFCKKPIFNRKYVTRTQLRRTFKKSLKHILGIEK